MNHQDMPWPQRFRHYQVALLQLGRAIQMAPLSEIEELGLIKAFEITHEVACDLMKDYLQFRGIATVTTAKEATREAYRINLIADGETWMEMIKSLTMIAHTYDAEVAEMVSEKVITSYYPLFQEFHEKVQELIRLD